MIKTQFQNREIELLKHILLPDSQTAKLLNIKECTVKYWMSKIGRKLNTQNRQQTLLIALKTGIIKSGQLLISGRLKRKIENFKYEISG